MDDPRAPYQQVAHSIRAEIRSGALPPGGRLPSVNELASTYGVAKMTVQKALNELREEGLIVSWQGRGTFVRERATSGEPEANADGPFEVIMRRLDAMHDEMRRLDARLSRVETEQKTQSPPPGETDQPAER